jgi:hypothetical protein
MTETSATQRGGEQAADKSVIRPFHVNVSEAELTELRRRIRKVEFKLLQINSPEFWSGKLPHVVKTQARK